VLRTFCGLRPRRRYFGWPKGDCSRPLTCVDVRAPGKIRTCDTRFRRLTEVAFGGAASGISAGHTLSVVVEAARCLAPRCATGVPRSSSLGSRARPHPRPSHCEGVPTRAVPRLTALIMLNAERCVRRLQLRGAPGGNAVRASARLARQVHKMAGPRARLVPSRLHGGPAMSSPSRRSRQLFANRRPCREGLAPSIGATVSAGLRTGSNCVTTSGPKSLVSKLQINSLSCPRLAAVGRRGVTGGGLVRGCGGVPGPIVGSKVARGCLGLGCWR